MSLLFWNPLSINYLIAFILAALIAGYFTFRLIKIKQNSLERRSTYLVVLTFGSASLGMLMQMLSTILRPDLANIALPIASPPGASSMAGFLLFSYYFLKPQGLGKRGGQLLILALVSLFAVEIFIMVQRLFLLRHNIVEFREAWVDIPFAIGFLGSFVFFFIHLVNSIREHEKIGILKACWRGTKALIWPKIALQKNAAASRAFFYVASFPLLVGAVLLARSYGIIDWRLALLLSGWFILLTFGFFMLTYLNYIPEQSSFRVKVIGISLISVLIISSAISWFVGTIYIEQYKGKNSGYAQTALEFIPQENRNYLIRNKSFHFDQSKGQKLSNIGEETGLPFAFPFYGERHSYYNLHIGGWISFDGLTIWRDIPMRFGPHSAIFIAGVDTNIQPAAQDATNESGVYLKEEAELVTITWNKLVSKYNPDEIYTYQLKLHADGKIEMAFEDWPDTPTTDVFRVGAAPMLTGIIPSPQIRTDEPLSFLGKEPIETKPNQGAIENHRLQFDTYLNRIYGPIAYFIIFVTLVIIAIFPLFFRNNLDRPLRNLLAAVRQVMNGNLATDIKVIHKDEIGYLALSFGKMAKAQHELVQSLESKVAQRTAEATQYAAHNARLEERNHLSRELHDSVNQALFSANLIADTLPDLLEQDPARAQGAADDIRRLNKTALTEMRQLLLELRSEKLSDHPFGELIESLIENLQKDFSTPIGLEIEADSILPEEVQLTFYRIAQEGIMNALKYSKANEIKVTFDGLKTQAMLTIEDNGIGFDPKQIKPGHMGLQFMKERIDRIGGSLEIDSAPDKGCRLTAIWFDEE